MSVMNLAPCVFCASRTIFKLIFFTVLSFFSIQAFCWDPDGAQRAFQEARQKRANLSQTANPSPAQYLECAKSYRDVYVKDPHYGRVGDAIYEEAVIYQEMGDRFSDPAHYRTAVKRFQLLIKDYGGNQNCPDALERVGRICSTQLNDETAAQEAYNLLKNQYKHSNAALRLNFMEAKIQTPKNAEQIKKIESGSAAVASVMKVRHLSASDHTLVTVEMDKASGYDKNRLSNPDRVYLDFSNARLSSDLPDRIIAVEDDILKQIRIAQFSASVVRIVLDCKSAGDFSIVERHSPYRIEIDLHQARTKSVAIPAAPSKAPPVETAVVVSKRAEPSVREAAISQTDKRVEPEGETSPPKSVSPSGGKSSKPPPPLAITPEPAAVAPKAALPTSQGDRTLTRMLGLKVNRIVIDPGHGGHDLGTIGPGGLMEKDFVLSLAIGLQKMLQDNLGSEVFLTRTDDSFISLEERTAIANQHRADLFISIHANSSKIPSISGVETYYLSFAKTNAEREIAARENATALSNVADLEDLIKKIAQADKSAESRELASTVQKKLFSGARQLLPSTQNRGVRTAPFVVLIGANMPSVLTEVAFISNPKVEKVLKNATNHEHLVKALFSGIEAYIKTLGNDQTLIRQVQKQ